MKPDPDRSFNSTPNRALKWLVTILGIFFLLEVALLITHARHAYFKIDGWFAFYAVLGLLACGLLVVIGRGLGAALRREETHYAPSTEEPLPEDLDESLR